MCSLRVRIFFATNTFLQPDSIVAFWVSATGSCKGISADCDLWGIHMEVSQGLTVLVRQSCVIPSHSEPLRGSEKRKPAV